MIAIFFFKGLLLVFCLGFIDEILLQWWLNFSGVFCGSGMWVVAGLLAVGMAEFFSTLSFFLHMAKCIDLWH